MNEFAATPVLLLKLCNFICKGSGPCRPQDSTSLGNSDCKVVTCPAPHLALACPCSRKHDSHPPPPLPTPSCSLLRPSNNQEAVTSQKLAFLPTDILRVKMQSTYQSEQAPGEGAGLGGSASCLKLHRLRLRLRGCSGGCHRLASSSYQGISCRCCHGDALFLWRQGKGDGEVKRTNRTATAPNCNHCPSQKRDTQNCAVSTRQASRTL